MKRTFEFARKLKNGKIIAEKAFNDAQLPEYQTACSAGADFFVAEDVVVPSIWSSVSPVLVAAKMENAGETDHIDFTDVGIAPTYVHTGVKSQMPEDEVLILSNRSSNPKKKGLVLANGIGVIDSDYYNNTNNDGDIIFAFYNLNLTDCKLKVGDRIGQGTFMKYLRPTKGLRVKDAIREGGLGSTSCK